MRKVMTLRVAAFAAVAVTAMAVGVGSLSQAAFAYDPFSACGSNCNSIKDTSLTQGATNFKAKNIINTALILLGSISIIMVVIGGIRMAASNGDPGKVKTGRETIIYSVVGLIIAMSAYAIINFVISFNW